MLFCGVLLPGWFKQEEAIYTLRGKLLKSEDQFMYFGSNISSLFNKRRRRLLLAYYRTYRNVISLIR